MQQFIDDEYPEEDQDEPGRSREHAQNRPEAEGGIQQVSPRNSPVISAPHQSCPDHFDSEEEYVGEKVRDIQTKEFLLKTVSEPFFLFEEQSGQEKEQGDMEQVYELVCSRDVRTEIVVQVPKNYQAYADTLGYVNADFSIHEKAESSAR